MISKCTICGRQCWTCRACNNRTYCEFCNHCNLHGQEPPAPEMIRPPRQARGRLFVVSVAFLTKRGWSGGVLGPCAVGGDGRCDLEGRAHRQTGASGATNPREAGQGQCGGSLMLISNGSHSLPAEAGSHGIGSGSHRDLAAAATGNWQLETGD